MLQRRIEEEVAPALLPANYEAEEWCLLGCSSETSVLTRATRRNNPEDTILHSHRRENLKSYNYEAALPRYISAFIFFLEI
jgi:hypothetical protein